MKLPLLVHSSEPVGHIYPGKGNTTPDKLYKLASNFPDNVIVFAHWGGGLPFYSLMPEVKRALGNVFYDMAASPLLYNSDVIREVVSLEGSNKILFGSDFPLIRQERILNQVMTSNLTNDQKARILGLNALPLVTG
jgi:predicted TIM-barrel fold metal-dependent hydrolase